MAKLFLVLIILKPLSVLFKPLRPKYSKLRDDMFFRDILFILKEGYMEFIISSILLLYYAPPESIDKEPFMVALAYSFLAMTAIILPGVCLWIMSKNISTS